jgi:hypothetical protein
MAQRGLPPANVGEGQVRVGEIDRARQDVEILRGGRANRLVDRKVVHSTLAADRFNRPRRMPHQTDAEAWLSRSTSSTRRPAEASAAARFTAVVVFPTPPCC